MRNLIWMVFWLLGAGASGLWRAAKDDDYQRQVQLQCSFTRYPNLCVRTLMELKDHPADMMIMSALVNKTISEISLPNSYFKNIIVNSQQLSVSGIQDAQRAQSVSDYCEELMRMSLKLLEKSSSALIDFPTQNKHNIQTWLSAALSFQQACKDSADSLGLSEISRKMDFLSELTSNPLALVNRISSKDKLRNNEEQNFPKWVSAKDRKLLQSKSVKANVVVAKDGSGNYKTVSEAIQAAASSSGKRYVVYVKSGVYKEKIRTNKDGITLIGDGKYSTIIAGDDSVAAGSSMPGTATFTITGDEFIARDIGFHNTAGPQGEQALALYVASDHTVFFRCSIAGYQDTLYALALRQFYRECDIYGTTDFIFGDAAAVFQSCYLVLRRPTGKTSNVILANGRTDPGQNTGFAVQSCRITAGTDFSPVKHNFNSYLGRPWKQYSRSIVMESAIDDAISSRGWITWPGMEIYTKTLYFAEYANSGGGAETSGRVKWAGFHVVEAGEAVKFTVKNFIAGTSWLPATGATFVSGLQ